VIFGHVWPQWDLGPIEPEAIWRELLRCCAAALLRCCAAALLRCCAIASRRDFRLSLRRRMQA